MQKQKHIIVPERLKEIMNFMDVSVKEFAETFERSEQYIYGILRGEYVAPLYIYYHLTNDVGINGDFLEGKSKVYMKGDKNTIRKVASYVAMKRKIKESFLKR